MFELKFDKKLPYHYIISVGIRDMYSEKRGMMFVKHGPIEFTNDQIEYVQDAIFQMEDKMLKTTPTEALEIFGVKELVQNILWQLQ